MRLFEMNMTRVSFTFTLTANVVNAPNTPEPPIVILENNISYSNAIPPQHQDLGIEDFLKFFKSFPSFMHSVVFLRPSFQNKCVISTSS